MGRGAPDGARRGHEHRQPAHHGQDLVARLDDLPRDGRPHDRRARRAQARARVRQRVDGRPQARRVRADAHLPRPRRHREASDERRDAQGRRRRGDAGAGGRRERRARADGRRRGGRGRGCRGGGGRRPHGRARGGGRKRSPRRRPTRSAEAEADGEPEAEEEAQAAPALARQEGRGGPRACSQARPRARRAGRARPRPRAGQVRAHLGPQGPPGVRPHPRQVRDGGARHPGPHPPPRGARLEQAARVGRRQRREQPRADRGRAAYRIRDRRRGADAQALPPARHGPRDARSASARATSPSCSRRRSPEDMGQKVHPESMRVGYIHDWKSNWFTERDFSDYLAEDVAIREPHHQQALPRGPVATSRSARTPTRWRSTSTRRVRAS